MDPYLENPADWPGFHHLLISAANEQLQAQLRPRGYYVSIGERIWLEEPGRSIYPDAAIIERPSAAAEPAAVAVADEPVRIKRIVVEIREAFLEIYDAKGNRLVTSIEFLSPANKSRGRGRKLYEQKRSEVLDAGASFVEIDLLRSGQHVLDVPRRPLVSLAPWSYLVNIIRPGQQDYEVYPISLRQRLPKIRVPLKPSDSDALLDLQAAANWAYDRGPFPDRLSYSAPPAPPLAADDAAWADQLLRTAGLRGAP
jgi:hypothetical protein